MRKYGGQICVGLLGAAVAFAVFGPGDAFVAVDVADGVDPFRKALSQLGVLYIVAVLVERSLEVLLKAWRQGGKIRLEGEAQSAGEDGRAAAEAKLRQYRVGTQRRALLFGLTLGIMVSLFGVRLLGSIFEFGAGTPPLQRDLFQFTDVIVTAGLIAGGSATIHKAMALIEDLLNPNRTRAKDS
ncbi:MAG: hypothetical protein OXI39_10100 [Gemmatimonadota bacterium]|uniref:hypothetical protein n=1 Tax=Candidatus Palauibacter scopulicola TaxID=3056741 RepID=UPI00239C9FEE|nr:hypothetical protein [Candidatus Palauibacter scopulicola]MDE2663338.1 hypothetical protein [Candidatus Palauibacter scopulicola]